MCYLLGHIMAGRINRSFFVKKITSRGVVVELGSAIALDGMFTIQNSHVTTFHFQHNGLVYCVCGKLHITIASPREYNIRPSQAYIINHYTWHHQNYWTLFISGNHTTTRIPSLQIKWDAATCSYLKDDWYHDLVLYHKLDPHYRTTYNPIWFAVSKKNTAVRFIARSLISAFTQN